jgi:hypothetical protein
MVGEAEIVAKPDDTGLGGLAGHQALCSKGDASDPREHCKTAPPGGPAGVTWLSTLLDGALFGLFCCATFELTSLSLLRHWTGRW